MPPQHLSRCRRSQMAARGGAGRSGLYRQLGAPRSGRGAGRSGTGRGGEAGEREGAECRRVDGRRINVSLSVRPPF